MSGQIRFIRRGGFKTRPYILILLAALTLFALPVFAQPNLQITMDQVNAIAKKLYCPVCPNETLDACQTQACAQWRDEIRDQLAAGQSEQQIIDSFVRRYGQRVIGTPDEPALRTLSLVTPFLIAGLALLVGAWTFTRWRRSSAAAAGTNVVTTPRGDAYRDQLEQDLRE